MIDENLSKHTSSRNNRFRDNDAPIRTKELCATVIHLSGMKNSIQNGNLEKTSLLSKVATSLNPNKCNIQLTVSKQK